MSRLRDRFRHAFAVGAPGAAEPTPEQQVAVDWVCRQIARRRLTTPGLIGLEMMRPLNFVSAQLMHFAEPAVWAIFPRKGHEHYKHFAAFLEHRGSLEYLAQRVEHFESEYERLEQERRRPPTKDETDP